MTSKNIPQLTEHQQRRFWLRVDKTGECWEWIGCRNQSRRGYGFIGVNGKLYQAHRVAYFLHSQVDPLQFLVCHKCDNTRCVNPNHLFLGTPADNMADRDKKQRGKFPVGERNGQSKLTEDDVVDIRKQYESGRTQKAIGLQYGVDHSTIGRITRRVDWSHI